jgi:hypothetical protein
LPGSLLPVESFSRVSPTDDRVVFCTGGAGTIGSAQVCALVHLGANACIVGRNVEKTQQMAVEIGTARPGSRVLGIGGVDVRNLQSLEKAVERCVGELGGIDYVMYFLQYSFSGWYFALLTIELVQVLRATSWLPSVASHQMLSKQS